MKSRAASHAVASTPSRAGRCFVANWASDYPITAVSIVRHIEKALLRTHLCAEASQ